MTEENKDFQVNSEVFFTAFLKEEPKVFYVCKGTLTRLPEGDSKGYRVQITAIADKPVGGKKDTKQIALLGRVITKRRHELMTKLGSLMTPGTWLQWQSKAS